MASKITETERWARRIVARAVELEDGPVRQRLVYGECGADPQVLHRVRELLEAHARFRDHPIFRVRGNGDDGASTVPTPPPNIPGFRDLRRLGEGAFGEVYAAHQEMPDRDVAIKVLKPLVGPHQAEAEVRFIREINLLGQLDPHEGLCAVYHGGFIDTADGKRPWYAMRLVRGGNLTEVNARSWPRMDRVALMVRVCRAVEYLHSKGVIHRDIKPTNILVELVEGVWTPRLVDFGIAGFVGDQARQRPAATPESLRPQSAPLTAAGQAIGTAGYMSPQQARGKASVHEDDTFAIGVVLFELLCGRRPEQGVAVWRQVGNHVAAARGDLSWIISCALNPDPAGRYPSVTDLREDLEAYSRARPLTNLDVRDLWLSQAAKMCGNVILNSAQCAATIFSVAYAAIYLVHWIFGTSVWPASGFVGFPVAIIVILVIWFAAPVGLILLLRDLIMPHMRRRLLAHENFNFAMVERAWAWLAKGVAIVCALWPVISVLCALIWNRRK